MGVDADPILLFVLQWLVFAAGTIIPTPGATGGAEAAFAALDASLVPAASLGLAIALWRLFTFHQQLILAAIILPWTLGERSPAPSASGPLPGPRAG